MHSHILKISPQGWMGLSGVLIALAMGAQTVSAGDSISVPVRWCGVEGAASMSDPSVVNETTTDNVLWRRHERPSDQIYIPQIDLTFRSGATSDIKNGPQSFPIIRDVSGSGGDLLNGENDDAIIMCRRVWTTGDPLYFDANNNSFVNNATDTLLTTDTAQAGIVGLGHNGAVLVPAPGDVMFVDADASGAFQVGEPIYRDENINGVVDAGDTLLVNVLETVIGNVNAADLGATLSALPAQVKYLDLIREPVGTFNIGYPSVQGVTAVNANDIDYTGIAFPVHGVAAAGIGGLGIVLDDASQYLPPGPDFTIFETVLVAHEFGHSFGLLHGDGVDDDGDGQFDEPDDPTAPVPGAGPGTLCDSNNVMSYCWLDNGTPGNPNMQFIGVGAPTVGQFTNLQRTAMRDLVLAQVPDRIVDPVVPPLVATRADDLGEIAAPFEHLDIAQVEVRVDSARASSTFSVQTRRPFPSDARDPFTFYFLVDSDRDETSGAKVESLEELGVPGALAGVEYVGIVKLRGRSVVGLTVFRYDVLEQTLGEIEDQSIRATVQPLEVIPDFPMGRAFDPDTPPRPTDRIPAREVISLIFPTEVLRLDETARLRAEFISVGPRPTIIDRARTSQLDFALPVFPECQVVPATVRPGAKATVLATGLLPNRPLHLLLGADEVAVGRADGDGRATLTLPVPSDARQGKRLVTVGALAVTADCTVTVDADADGGDPGDGSVPGARYLYNAQFLCGPASEALQPGVAEGLYQTLLTITNTTSNTIKFAKRVSRALPRQDPGAVSEFVLHEIQPQHSIAVECNELRHMLPVPMTTQFRSGALLIYSDERLDVTAVYTARAADGAVSSVQTLRVEAQQLK